MSGRETQQKRVIIVGASSGIGLSAARAMAARGYRLGLAARRTAPLEALRSEFPDLIVTAAIDVNSPDAPAALNSLIERNGGMDIYFHVAGIGYDNPSLLPGREAEIIATNAAGFARMVSAAYDYFRDHCGGRGHIAAITSVAGTKGIGEMSAYSASKKCAQTYLTAIDQLAHIRKTDIRITDIRPGWISTPLLHSGEKYMMEMTTDHATGLILRAIDRRKRVAYIDWRWGALCRLWRLIPDCLWKKMNFPVAGRKT